MANVDTKLTESVIKQIMEGADPRVAIDAALDEKAGFHKEKRIRDGKAQVVNVKNSKRKVHHTLTADQKKAIKKAHSAQANKKRAKSLKKGAKMGLYKEGIEMEAQVMEPEIQEAQVQEVNPVVEAEAEAVAGLVLSCPACAEGSLEIVDGEGEDLVLVCPACGETFVICSTSEIEEDDDDDDDDKDESEEEAPADEEAPAEEEVPAEPADEEAPQDESCETPETCDDENCDGENCEECAPECESGLFFAAEE